MNYIFLYYKKNYIYVRIYYKLYKTQYTLTIQYRQITLYTTTDGYIQFQDNC